MNTNINLLVHRNEELLKQKKRIRAFNLAAVGSLVIVGLISVSVFLLTQVVDSTSNKKNQEDVLKKMSQYQDRQTKLLILNDRIENVGKIMKIKKDVSNIMSVLLPKIPDQLSIENFEVNGSSVIINGKSKSLSVIGEFINNLTDMVRKKEIIKSLTLNSLLLDENNNTYTVLIKSEL